MLLGKIITQMRKLNITNYIGLFKFYFLFSEKKNKINFNRELTNIEELIKFMCMQKNMCVIFSLAKKMLI